MFINTDYRIGFHVSKWAPSLLRSFKGYIDLPFICFQIYTSNRDWNLPDHSNQDLIETGKFLQDIHAYLCIHGSLLNNLCGSVNHQKDPKFSSKLARVREFVTRELDFGAALGAGVVVHPGSCKDKEKGLKIIAETITHCLTTTTTKSETLASDMNLSDQEFKKRRKIILENASGGGTKLAVTLEEIATIIKHVPKELHPQVKVCIDTAHAFGAGLYKWGEPKEVLKFYKDFDSRIGLDFLEVFHLNDSRISEQKRQNAPFGSGKDVHEYLGEGYIFQDRGVLGLKEFLSQALERNIPVIGEPPAKDKDGNPGLGYKKEWKTLVEILGESLVM